MSLKSVFFAIVCASLAAAPALAVEGVNGTVFTSSPVTVKVHQDFIIALPSNPTTGYSWSAKSNNAAIVVEGSAYQPSGSKLMGAGGQQLFILESTAAGTATVTFAYGRPWQKGMKPSKTMTFTVTATK